HSLTLPLVMLIPLQTPAPRPYTTLFRSSEAASVPGQPTPPTRRAGGGEPSGRPRRRGCFGHRTTNAANAAGRGRGVLMTAPPARLLRSPANQRRECGGQGEGSPHDGSAGKIGSAHV